MDFVHIKASHDSHSTQTESTQENTQALQRPKAIGITVWTSHTFRIWSLLFRSSDSQSFISNLSLTRTQVITLLIKKLTSLIVGWGFLLPQSIDIHSWIHFNGHIWLSKKTLSSLNSKKINSIENLRWQNVGRFIVLNELSLVLNELKRKQDSSYSVVKYTPGNCKMVIKQR